MSAARDNVVPFVGRDDASDEDLVRIEPGDYDAEYVKHHVRNVFGGTKLAVEFKIVTLGPAFEQRVIGWYNVRSRRRGEFTVGKHSKFAREWRLVFSRSPERWDRVPMSALRSQCVRIRVRTVEVDSEGAKLAEVNRYSVLDSILGRVEA